LIMNFNKFNNFILFFLGLYVPFINTFSNSSLQNFDAISVFFIGYLIIFNKLLSNGPLHKNKTPIIYCVVIMFVLEIISAVFSYDFDMALQQLLVDLKYLVIFIGVSKAVYNEQCIKYIFWGLLIGFFLSVMIAYLQSFGYKQFQIYKEQDLNANTNVNQSEQSIDVLRIWGPFNNALNFSYYLSVVGAFLYAYSRMVLKKTYFSIIILVLAILTISLTVSRTALAGFLLAIVLFEHFHLNKARKRLFYSLGFVVFFIGFVYYGPQIIANSSPVIDRFLASNDDFITRKNFWVGGWNAFINDIFLGTGPGNLYYELYKAKFQFPNATYSISDPLSQHVESYFLTILYTFGIFAFYYVIKLYYSLLKFSIYSFNAFKRGNLLFTYTCCLTPAIFVIAIGNIPNPALLIDQRNQLLFILLASIVNFSYKQIYVEFKISGLNEAVPIESVK